jgi:hypothetical protein
MAEFDVLRERIAADRRRSDELQREALLAHEATRKVELALAEARAHAGTDHDPNVQRLLVAAQEATDRSEKLRGTYADLRAELDERIGVFGRLADPREQLPRLPDRVPILLMPLRIETRFKPDLPGGPELWVRAYPDSCFVDTFEPTLTEREVENARAFWAAIWRAGGDPGMRRAAWRQLVASQGSGRSGWITSQYRPLNEPQVAIRGGPDEVILVVVADGPQPADVATYWEAAWRGQGSAAALQAAFDALVLALGQATAEIVVQTLRPVNFDDQPPAGVQRSAASVSVAVLQLTPAEDLATRRTAWSSAPKVEILPDRLVLLAYPDTGNALVEVGNPIPNPLATGPDPNAPASERLRDDQGELQIPDAMTWMFDFERALKDGMAFRIPLTAAQATSGFQRLLVLGVRMGDTPTEGREALEKLLEHHLHSRAGFEFVPQGTPTNNTEKGASGWSFRDDADGSFVTLFEGVPAYQADPDPLFRADGQWIADLLGLREDLVQQIPHAGGADQRDARAMQIALWPGTLGYLLETQLAPIVPTDVIADTRMFFTRYVSGRGPLPAVRVGRQPYGIVLATSFGQVDWFGEETGSLGGIKKLIDAVDADRKALLAGVSQIGRPGDPHQVLLDVLGLHPATVEYYPLHAESVAHHVWETAFLDSALAVQILGIQPAAVPLALLRKLGYDGQDVPEILDKIWRREQTPLDGPLIDDRPLSEQDRIRTYATNDRNYIRWLVDAARTSLDAVRREADFTGGRPKALLYLLLRHAIQTGYYDAGIRLAFDAGLIQDVAVAKREPAFVHVAERTPTSESRYELLYRAEPAITNDAALRVAEYIAREIRVVAPDLAEQTDAIERLADVPTARLERAFAEHIDTVTYRLDAWKTGLLTWELERLRSDRDPDGSGIERGLFLGAFGWVEPLRPEGKVLTPAEIPDDVRQAVDRKGDAPLMTDSTNGGLIHAASIGHATTAAVLRNAYRANEGRLAIDLSSRRVRLALEILDGIRNGQSLGALLGYRFERHVHDNGPLGVRDLIYAMRRAFPLAADRIRRTAADGAVPADAEEAREAIAAMNVVDGRLLVEHVKTHGGVYPFGLATLPPSPPAGEAQALEAAVAHVLEVADAVADLVLAEGVHQAVLGNYERASGTLEAFATGSHPTEPDVVRTPRSGTALTLRTAIHLDGGVPADPLPTIPATPLALAEPAIDAWLAGLLPPPASVGCLVRYTSRTTGNVDLEFISQQQLGLRPIDLLYRTDARPGQALGDLDDVILGFLHRNRAPRFDREIVIEYTTRDPGHVTWFQLQALVRSLRTLVTTSRPVQPSDLVRGNDGPSVADVVSELPVARIQQPRTNLDAAVTALDGAAALNADPTKTVDEALEAFTAALEGLSAYRMPGAGSGFAYEWRAATYNALANRVTERVTTWNARLARFDTLLQDELALPATTPESDRIAALRAAEIVISTTLTTPEPPSATAYRTALAGRKTAFVTKRDALTTVVSAAHDSLASFLAAVRGELPLDAFDGETFDLEREDEDVAAFRTRLTADVARLRADVVARMKAVDDALVAHQAASAPARARILQDVGRALFGEDFVMVPRFHLPAVVEGGLVSAVGYSQSGQLTAHAQASGHDPLPVDDWLHGVARVRDKMRHWENVALLGDVLRPGTSFELTPLQLPFAAGESWLALEVPPAPTIDSDRLLYTAHFATPFAAGDALAGLLVDEWTEVIPASTETTGIAFHYDRPNAEPPQAWVLALSAVRDGAWHWDELLGAVTDALESAQRRAIEPGHIEGTPYSWFAPATMSAYSFPEVTISNIYLRNVADYDFIDLEADQ